MKDKELIQRLSRLQSRAYNLQVDLQRLITEIEKEKQTNNKKGGNA